MFNSNDINWQEIEEEEKYKALYIGHSGYTSDCLIAIDAILNSGRLPENATLVSTPQYSKNGREHLFLLWNWWHFPLTIIPSGFQDGYSGEGAKGFSLALCMFREKNIPIYWHPIKEAEFKLIDLGKLLEIEHPIYKKIKLEAELLTWPWPEWILDKDEELLQKEQLWKRCYWRNPKTDWITESISNIELFNPVVGQKLRLAKNKILKSDKIEEFQSTGLLIRDAWIELVQDICNELDADTSGIGRNDVKKMLKKLELSDEIINSASAIYDLGLKVQHDRKIIQDTAKSCITSSIF